MNNRSKDWLTIYLEHARHLAHQHEPSIEVASHLWQMAFNEGWDVLRAYLWESVPRAVLKRADQWALNMVILPDALKEGFDFSGCDLRWVVLKKQHLESICFDGATLIGANFEGAELEEASLNNANLEGAILKEADLTDASFESANLISADLSSISCARRCVFDHANLRYANLSQTDLQDVSFFGADLRGSNSSEAFPDAFWDGALYNSSTTFCNHIDTHRLNELGLIFIE